MVTGWVADAPGARERGDWRVESVQPAAGKVESKSKLAAVLPMLVTVRLTAVLLLAATYTSAGLMVTAG